MINCLISKIFEYIDYHRQALVKTIPSYVKDTNNFLDKMKDINNVSEEKYLVTMDVKSFYTNIPKSEGTAATKRALYK